MKYQGPIYAEKDKIKILWFLQTHKFHIHFFYGNVHGIIFKFLTFILVKIKEWNKKFNIRRSQIIRLTSKNNIIVYLNY